ncbi:MAG: transglutaminase-like cysteine peptidase [Thiogranum sp.]
MPEHHAPRARTARRLLHCLGMLLGLAASPPALMADDSATKSHMLDLLEQQYGSVVRVRYEDWQQLIASASGLSDLEKLRRVNAFFNEVTFVNDIDHWGVEDYWATPLQLLASNGGDCEDFSIAKYFTLREMGVPAKRLRLTYVKALDLNQAHMVLTYFRTPDADPLVLDNLVGEIRKSSSRDDLLPVYSFNAEGLWLAKERGNEQHIGKPERLSRWKEVVARINTEQLLQVDAPALR